MKPQGALYAFLIIISLFHSFPTNYPVDNFVDKKIHLKSGEVVKYDVLLPIRLTHTMRDTYRHGTALATGKQGAWEPLAANVVASQGAKLSCRGPRPTKKLMTYVEYKKLHGIPI